MIARLNHQMHQMSSTREGGDEVAVRFQVRDLDTFHKVLESPATAEAMAHDGIDKSTVRTFVLDKQFAF